LNAFEFDGEYRSSLMAGRQFRGLVARLVSPPRTPAVRLATSADETLPELIVNIWL